MAKQIFARTLAVLLISAALLAGCSTEVGGECDTQGSTSECVSGSVCSVNGGGALECQVTCKSGQDCAVNFECVDVAAGSGKSCRPRFKTR